MSRSRAEGTKAMATPDGIEEPAEKGGLWDRHASPISILLLGALMLAALSGVAGGQPGERRLADFGEAKLLVKSPSVIRNGEFFEMEIAVEAKTDLDAPAIEVSPSLWRDMTINTMMPAPAEELFEKGGYRFAYDRMPRGKRLLIKIDGQINPPLFAGTRGDIAVYDGERRLGAMPLAIEVLP